MAWYIAQTTPQGERTATEELRRAGLRVYLPKESLQAKHRRTGAPVIRRRVLLKGYVFIRFPEAMHDDRGVPPFISARSCRGVRGILTAANEHGEWAPLPIPDKAVAEFMRRQRRREFGRPAIEDKKAQLQRMRNKYAAGKHVNVSAGPFAGFLAMIDNLLEDGSVQATFSIFGRPTTVRFSDPETSLRPVELAAA